jgi:F0F1-type ATP synthase assembly protein I
MTYSDPENREKRELQQGFGDAFSAAFEMIATPAIFGVVGWYLDRRLGTTPWLLIGLVLFTASYQIFKMYSVYAAKMDAIQQEMRDRREEQRLHA